MKDIQKLAPYKNLVIRRKNAGVGDIIMSLPVLDAVHKINPLINIYLDIDESYKKLFRVHPHLRPYNGEGVDLCYDFTDGFEKSVIEKHRTDIFADFLKIEVNDKKPKLYIEETSLISSTPVIVEKPFGLIFLKSANYLRQIPDFVAEKFSSILQELGLKVYFVGQNFLDVNSGLVFLEIEDLLWLIKNAVICIGPDSGPMHVAGALDTPFLAVCNTIAPELRYKYYDGWGVIRTVLNLDCLYSCNHDCPYDFPPPCLKFFDFMDIKHKVEILLKS